MKLTKTKPLNVIRNPVTNTAIITVPSQHAFLFPVPDADPPAAGAQMMKVSVITVFPPTSPLAARHSGGALPVFMLSGIYSSETDPDEFYDCPVRLTDISCIPRVRTQLRETLSNLLQEFSRIPAPPHRPGTTSTPDGEGGEVITVDFSAKARRAGKSTLLAAEQRGSRQS